MPNAITLPRPRAAGRRRRRRIAGNQVGQLIWTPAMVRDYVRQTAVMFDAVDRDYQAAKAAGKLPPSEGANWVAFRDSFRAFVKDATDWSGGTADRAEDYRRQLQDWRARVARYVTPSSPQPHVESKSALFSWGGGVGVGVVVAVAVIVYLMSRVPKGASE